MSKILIGKSADGKNVSFDLDLVLRTRLLIQANSGGGKSYLIRRLVEQLFGKVQIFLIDREGEFASLREKFGFLHVGHGGDTPADVRSARALAEKLLELRVSAVLDLYEAFRSKPGDRRAWVRNFLEGVLDAPKALWRPLLVVVDEAHQFCPQETPKAMSMAEREVISGCKDAMVSLATVGRKRGFGSVWATQRLAKLDKDASAELFNRLVGMTIEDVDVDRAADLMSVSKDERQEFKLSLKKLEPGNFFAFGRAVSNERVLVKVGPVQTTHPEPGSPKHAEAPPPPPETIKHLLPKLSDFPKEQAEKAKTEAELRAEVRALTAELAKAKRQPPVPPAAAKAAAAQVKPAPPSRVEVPVIKPALLVRVERAMTQAVLAAAHLREFSGKVSQEISAVENRGRKALGESRMRPEDAVRPRPPVELPARRPARREAPADPQGADREEASAAEIPPRRQRILDALSEMEALSRFRVRKACVAAMAGSSPNTGGFKNDCGALRAAGYVSYPSAGEMALTASGRALAKPAAPPSDDVELLERCLKILPPRRKAILKVVHQAYPGALSREEIAEAISVSPAAGGFKNDLGAMRSMELIDYPEPNTAKAAAWMFLQEEGVA